MALMSWPRLMSGVVLMLMMVTMAPLPSDACFHLIEPLKASRAWIQPTGAYSHVRYQAELGHGGRWNPIRLHHHSRHPAHNPDKPHATKSRLSQMTMTCTKVFDSKRALVRLDYRNSNESEFQCIEFKRMTENVIMLMKTSIGATEQEVNCDIDSYYPEEAVLTNAHGSSPESCSSQRSYQATLFSSLSKKASCRATIQHLCEQNRAIVSFDARCKVPIFKHLSSKRRQRLSFELSCTGTWKRDEDNSTIQLLRDDEDGLNFWCIQYKKKGSTDSDEVLEAYINFNGICSFSGDGKASSSQERVMHGNLVSFVSSRDERCPKISDENSDSSASCLDDGKISCSDSNSCPMQCKRCFQVPKFKQCEFNKAQLGDWETLTSSKDLAVHVGTDGIKTSSHGQFFCTHGEDAPSPYVTSVVQYNQTDEQCMPFYGCISAFSPAPGVLTFYLRPTSMYPWLLVPTNCAKTNEVFKKYPTEGGKMVTLLNEAKLETTSCGFEESQQFRTGMGSCLLDVEVCSGKCDTLNISLNNETCPEEAILLPVAASHKCHASLKFTDGIRGLLTYSEELGKYSCWIFTSSRLFITESYLCNYEAVSEVFRDKQAVEKYDPIGAFTIEPLQNQNKGTLLHASLTIPVWTLLCAFTLMKLMQH